MKKKPPLCHGEPFGSAQGKLYEFTVSKAELNHRRRRRHPFDYAQGDRGDFFSVKIRIKIFQN